MGAVDKIANPVVFFDGVCNLCSSSVLFIIKRDKKNTFKFNSLQSPNSYELLRAFDTNTEDLQSIILLQNGKIYTESSAVLQITRQLSGLWPILYVFAVIPKFIRDGLYRIVAKNRYGWFGRKDQCMIPSPALKAKFLD